MGSSGVNHQGSSWPELTPEQAEIVKANTALVHYFVRRTRTSPDEYEDRVQDGMLGLIRAAQLYDSSTGYTFSTYAQHWIRQAMQRGIAVVEGRNFRQAHSAGEEYRWPASLDAQVLDDANERLDLALSSMALVDHEDPADVVVDLAATSELMRLVESACDDWIDRRILRARLGGLSWAAIGESAGVSREMVRKRFSALVRRARGLAEQAGLAA